MKTITAAGLVTFRTKPKGERQVLVVHRPSYDDWSLPKGKLDPDEYLGVCAVRENYEETAVKARLGLPINMIKYPVSAGEKIVHYWQGRLISQKKRRPDREIDQVVWLPIEEALARLSYPDERGILDQAVSLPQTTPLLLVRHAKAMLRKNWMANDQERPLVTRGRRQADGLIPLLEAFGVERVATSPSRRCLNTVKPFAKAARIEIEKYPILTEEEGVTGQKQVVKLIKKLAKETGRSGEPIAVCGHRPVLGFMMTALGVMPWTMKTAEVCAVHLNETGKTVAIDVHKSRF